MNKLAVVALLSLFVGCNRPSASKSESGNGAKASQAASTVDLSGDRMVYVEAHNMDKASKLDMEPFVLHEANRYLSGNGNCSGVFITKNRGRADYELRFDYVSAGSKVQIIGRLTILWDKSAMVVGTWSGDNIKQVVDQGASEVCSRIALMRSGQSGDGKP